MDELKTVAGVIAGFFAFLIGRVFMESARLRRFQIEEIQRLEAKIQQMDGEIHELKGEIDILKNSLIEERSEKYKYMNKFNSLLIEYNRSIGKPCTGEE